MALVAKPVSAVAPSSVAANRPANLARTGTPSNLSGAVDSISPTGGASIGDGGFSVVGGQEGERDFNDQPSSDPRQGGAGGALPNPHTGVVNVTSQGFVSLLELRDTVTVASESGGGRAAEYAGRLIGQAVALYEASIENAEGNLNIRGESISLTL